MNLTRGRTVYRTIRIARHDSRLVLPSFPITYLPAAYEYCSDYPASEGFRAKPSRLPVSLESGDTVPVRIRFSYE